MAPIRTFSQSSSVFGSTCTTPFFEMSHVTASKMLSASGSIVYRISSFTETTGFIGPISGAPATVFCAGSFDLFDGVADFDVEHAVTKAADAATSRRASRLALDILVPILRQEAILHAALLLSIHIVAGLARIGHGARHIDHGVRVLFLRCCVRRQARRSKIGSELDPVGACDGRGMAARA